MHSSAVVHLTRAYKADVPAGPGARITQSRRVTGQPKLTRNDSLGLKTATSPVLGRQTSGIPYASATCRYPPPPDTTSPTTTVDPLDRTTPGPAVVPTVPAGQTIGYWMPSSSRGSSREPGRRPGRRARQPPDLRRWTRVLAPTLGGSQDRLCVDQPTRRSRTPNRRDRPSPRGASKPLLSVRDAWTSDESRAHGVPRLTAVLTSTPLAAELEGSQEEASPARSSANRPVRLRSLHPFRPGLGQHPTHEHRRPGVLRKQPVSGHGWATRAV